MAKTETNEINGRNGKENYVSLTVVVLKHKKTYRKTNGVDFHLFYFYFYFLLIFVSMLACQNNVALCGEILFLCRCFRASTKTIFNKRDFTRKGNGKLRESQKNFHTIPNRFSRHVSNSAP